jgi:hypothetical protein
MFGLAQITEASELTLSERLTVIALLESSFATQLVDCTGILGRRAQTVIDLGIRNCEDRSGGLVRGAAGGGRRFY